MNRRLKSVPTKGQMPPALFVAMRRRPQGQGFTLVELLTVMSLILILMGMIVGVGVYAKTAANRARCRGEVQELHNALASYRMDTGGYPLQGTGPGVGLNLVRDRLPKQIQTRLSGRNLSPSANPTNVLDPWKRDYIYVFSPSQPESYTLYSEGPKSGVAADDIYSGK